MATGISTPVRLVCTLPKAVSVIEHYRTFRGRRIRVRSYCRRYPS